MSHETAGIQTHAALQEKERTGSAHFLPYRAETRQFLNRSVQPEVPIIVGEVLDSSVAQRVWILPDLSGALADDVEARFKAKQAGRNFGPVTPWKSLTDHYGGSIDNGLHIVMGTSGVGKTAYALQIASGCECPALYVSCEMSRLELFRRLCARATTTGLGRFKAGDMTPHEARSVALQTATAYPMLAILDSTQEPTDRAEIERHARNLKTRFAADHVFVVVDSLHSWAESRAGTGDEREAVAAACRDLRTLASALCCPIMAISEQNRTSQGGGRDAPQSRLIAGAGSRKIEYGSESVVYLDGKEVEDAGGERAVVLTFEKNRNGAKSRRVDLSFNGKLQRYREVAK